MRKAIIGVALTLLLAAACGNDDAVETGSASTTSELDSHAPPGFHPGFQSVTWHPLFTDFDVMVASSDAVVLATVEETVPETPPPERHPSEAKSVRTRLRVDEQLYGDRQAPGIVHVGSMKDMYGGEGPYAWPEWREQGTEVVVFLGFFPNFRQGGGRGIPPPEKAWYALNGQGTWIRDGDDLGVTIRDDDMHAEVASLSYDEFLDRLDAAREKVESGEVKPIDDSRRNPAPGHNTGPKSGPPPPEGPDEG